VNGAVREAMSIMEDIDPVNFSLGGSPFKSQKGTIYSSQHVNRKLKRVFKAKNQKITSHSLRKGFGKRLYEASNQNIALVQLALRHSSPEDTLRYIGVTQDEMDECYNLIL
jgi:integrase